MSRLVVVSNRVAVGGGARGDTGGLAVALRSALENRGGIWFGWSGEIGPKVRQKVTEEPPIKFVTVDLRQRDYDEYYNGFANSALWPIFHYRLDLAHFVQEDYTGYQRVNGMFARRLLPLLKPDDIIWIHDYHLIPLAFELRRAGVKQKIGFFLHTPFPSTEILTALPSHQNIVRDLCGFDLVGFQTETDLRNFRDYIQFEAQGSLRSKNRIEAFGRTFHAGAFPIGIDTEGIAAIAQRAPRAKIIQWMQRQGADFSWMIGVDRLDYSKGIRRRFSSFELLLEKYPAYRGHVRLLQIAPPSRAKVREYQDLREQLESKAGHINGRFAELDWLPLNFIVKSYAQRSLTALYRTANVCLVTPLRDGMNLVAKEYVASQDSNDPGVLVLSRFAGASKELQAACTVNPFDIAGTTDAIARALDMPLEERIERWEAMMVPLRANTVDNWAANFLKGLEKAPSYEDSAG